MKKFLQKSCAWIAVLVAMFAMSMSAMAQEKVVTFDFTSSSSRANMALGPWGTGYVTSEAQDIQEDQECRMEDVWLWGSGSGTYKVQGNYERLYLYGALSFFVECKDDSYLIKSIEFVSKTSSFPGFFYANWGYDYTQDSNSLYHHVYTPSAPEAKSSFSQSSGYSYIGKIIVTLVSAGPSDPIDYTVNFTGEVPEGCSASYGDETFTKDGSSFSVAKNLKKEDLNVTTTEDYYAEVTLEGTTFNVEFKHYYYYNFVIEGSNEGCIRELGEWRPYKNGNSLKVKTALPESDFEADDVNGYDKSEISFEAVDAYTTNVKVTYTEKAAQTYYVTFPENAPDGVSVKVYVDPNNPLTFTETSTFQTNLDLRPDYFQVTTPATHWCESEWNCYDEDTHTFTVKLHKYLQYAVAVEGTDDANAGVKYNYATYHAGDVIYTSYEITNSDLTAVDVNGYTSVATVEGNTVKVTYTEIPAPTAPWSITFDADGQAQCQTVDKNGYKAWYASSDYDYGTEQYVPCYKYDYTDYAAADDYIILPAVKLEAGKSYTVTVNTRCYSSSWAERMEVVYGTEADVEKFNYTAIPNTTVNWTSRKDLSGDISVDADGKYYFAIHATSDAGMYYLFAYSFSIEEAAGPAPRDCVVDIKSDFTDTPWLVSAVNPAVGEVSSIASNITIYLDTNCESTHTYYNGDTDIPVGVTMVDSKGTAYTIAQFNYWANDTQVGVVLANSITTPGTYTLTIPAGAIPCVDNKANKAMTFTWTVLDPVVGHLAMSAAGYATLCVDYAYTLPEGYTAYAAGKDVDGVATLLNEDGTIVLTRLNSVAAGTPVIIEGPEATDVELLRPSYSPSAPEVNFLAGNTTDSKMTFTVENGLASSTPGVGYDVYGDDAQLYQLAKENDLVGFYRQVEDGSTLQCAAHKAFLVVPNAVAASNARLLFPGQTITGINTVATEGIEKIYNLQGQRVNAAKAGVYVKNGKKVIVK